MNNYHGMPRARANRTERDTELRELSKKEQTLVDALPRVNWSVPKAGLLAGFTKGYSNTSLCTRCKHDPALVKAISDKRILVAKEQGWNVDVWLREASQTLASARGRRDGATEATMIRLIGQHLGVFDADNRQKAPTLGMIFM